MCQIVIFYSKRTSHKKFLIIIIFDDNNKCNDSDKCNEFLNEMLCNHYISLKIGNCDNLFKIL